MIGNKANEAVPRLIDILQKEKNEDLSLLIIAILPKLADSGNAKNIIDTLSFYMKDEDIEKQFGATKALVELYQNAGNKYLSTEANDTLKNLANKDIVIIIGKALQSPSLYYPASEFIQEIWSDWLPILIYNLRNNDDNLRIASTDILVEIGESGLFWV